MEQIMGQIEQDILYGDDETPPGASPFKVSPTGVLTPSQRSSGAVPPKVEPGATRSMLDFMGRQVGPLTVWQWAAVAALGAGAVVGSTYLLTRNSY